MPRHGTSDAPTPIMTTQPLHHGFADRSVPSTKADRFLVPAGRLLFSLIFLVSAPMHFSSNAGAYAASQGVPMPHIAVPLAGIIALVGGISVLLGYKARAGAWLIVIFLVPVTLMMHKFWAATDPRMMQMQFAMFMKNLSMLGTALLIAYYGAGPVSIDARHPT